MEFIADTHTHFYNCYNLKNYLDCALFNLSALARQVNPNGQIKKLLFLCDRQGQRNFSGVFTNKTALNEAGYQLLDQNSEEFAIIADLYGHDITIVNGKQVVSQEKIEILALGCARDIRDGENALSIIDKIRSFGALPVLSWSPGKWLFTRGRLIHEIIERFNKEEICLGDVSIRGPLFCEPRGFLDGVEKGIKILAGTDPLPISRDQYLVGTYAAYVTNIDSDFNNFVELLKGGSSNIGNRNSLIESIYRMVRANL